jgi:DNA-binding MarR family transcriptional regulator
MSQETSSSRFTDGIAEREPLGPPLIGALLRMPVDAVRRQMIDRLHAHGFADIDPAHLIVLRYPGPQGERPSDLAAQLGLTKQALNYQLGQLERRGYLERRPDPDDQRSRRIVLTRRGVAAAHVIRDAVAELETLWARELGEKRYAQLRGLLVDLNRVI